MKKIALFVLFSLVWLSACSAAGPAPTASPTPEPSAQPTPTETPGVPIPPFEELVSYFDYDASADLGFSFGRAVEDERANVERVNFIGASGCNILGYLVSPEGEGAFPAVIFMHMGQENKDQYLEEAILLAGHGVVSLLFDSPFLRGCASDDRSGYINTVIDVRRGIDLLETFENIDRERIGYVGHSFGATWGGVLAGVEPRIKAFVLIAGAGQISQLDSPEVPDLDAIHYIGHSQAAFLFQFSPNDNFISEAAANRYFEAAPEPKTILWYDTTHRGLQDAGQADRLEWLGGQLGFEYP